MEALSDYAAPAVATAIGVGIAMHRFSFSLAAAPVVPRAVGGATLTSHVSPLSGSASGTNGAAVASLGSGNPGVAVAAPVVPGAAVAAPVVPVAVAPMIPNLATNATSAARRKLKSPSGRPVNGLGLL